MSEQISDAIAVRLSGDVQEITQELREFRILSAEAYTSAADYLKRVKGKAIDLESRRVYLKAPSLEACRRIDEWFRGPISALKKVEDGLKEAMLSFRKEQEREAERLRRIAQAAAEGEQYRLAKEALKIKLKADLERQELERKAREVRDQKERERLEEAARIRQQAGDLQARELEARAEIVKAPEIKAAQVFVAGTQVRRVWRFQVTDVARVPDDYKVVNTALLNEMARSLKDRAPDIPGIRFYSEETIASEAR